MCSRICLKISDFFETFFGDYILRLQYKEKIFGCNLYYLIYIFWRIKQNIISKKY